MANSNLYTKIKTNNATWRDLEKFLKLKEQKIDPYLKLAQNFTTKSFGNKLKIYTPGKKFPAISITGTGCSLNCSHCNKKYLESMKLISNKTPLKNYLFELSERGGTGALISGGCDSNGEVPLLSFLDVITEVKKKTDLIINVHTGLLNERTAKRLAKANVDIISFDITMDREIIRDIYHLNKDIKAYKKAIKLLNSYRLNVVPHICIGLYYGKLHKELEAIKFLKESGINPSLIVFLVLIPPTVSKEIFEIPNHIDIAKIIAATRFIYPTTEISLGCMRPRKRFRQKIETLAINSGITRIEIPSKRTLKWLETKHPNIKLQHYSACCAIPEKYEAKMNGSLS